MAATDRGGPRILGGLFLLAALLAAAAAGAASARVEVQRVADTSALGPVFAYDVAPSGAVLVLTGDNIRDAGSGEPLFGAPLRNPAGLSLAGEKLLFLADGALYSVEGRAPRKLVDVPLRSPVAISDGRSSYIAGVTGEGRSVLFLHREGAGHKPLLELDRPVDAMAFRRGALLFSAGSRIFALREGGKAAAIAELPGFPFILSLAVDDRDGTVYFSDGDSTYAMHGERFVLVRRGMGGILRFRKGALYLLSLREKAIFRFSGLAEAMSAPGALVPLKDPRRDPVVSLYCEAEERRARLKAAAAFERAGDGADSGELRAFAEEQGKGLETVQAALEKKAVSGALGVLWGGGNEPRAIGAGTAVSGGKAGAGIALWDGSGATLGPGSKAVLGGCAPSGECRLALEKGLLYVETAEPPAEGTAIRRPARHTVETGVVTLVFDAAKVALFSSGDAVAVVAVEGRVKAVSPGGGSGIMASGETIEARRGEPLGASRPARMDRLNRWWEEIR